MVKPYHWPAVQSEMCQRSQTAGVVIQPFCMVAEDVSILSVGPQHRDSERLGQGSADFFPIKFGAEVKNCTWRLFCVVFFLSLASTLCLKNVSTLIANNFYKLEPILIIFGSLILSRIV